MGMRDGDGWVLCHCSRHHWGLYGAAGLLVVRRDLEEPHVLLQLRAAWTHGGGTWAIPGGALDSHESPVEAAIREAEEEAGILSHHLEVKGIYSDDHGNWRYDTVIAHAHSDAGARLANHEADDFRWVMLHEVPDHDLHPGLRSSWASVHAHVLQTLRD